MELNCFCPNRSLDEFNDMDFEELDLSGRTFFTSRTPMISHFPINPELKIERMLNEIRKRNLKPVEPLRVIFEDGMISGTVMIEVEPTEVKDSNLRIFKKLKLVGRSYIGPAYLVPKALKEFNNQLISKNMVTSGFYFWYHSCRKCQPGKESRTLILGKID